MKLYSMSCLYGSNRNAYDLRISIFFMKLYSMSYQDNEDKTKITKQFQSSLWSYILCPTWTWVIAIYKPYDYFNLLYEAIFYVLIIPPVIQALQPLNFNLLYEAIFYVLWKEYRDGNCEPSKNFNLLYEAIFYVLG